ncbi:MAG: globin [Cytophagales bacterium]|nr:globin [Armatimonadota bacterium]
MSIEGAGIPKISPDEIYARVGGDDEGGPEAFGQLVDAFYAGVAADPVLRPMYPEGDLAEEKENLALFLIQYFGGPALYAMKRGHPRLRMRHVPFSINAAARDAWLHHMNAALDATPAFAPYLGLMRGYFTQAAHFLQNRAG